MVIRKAALRDVSPIFHMIEEATRRGKVLKRSRQELRHSYRHFWVVERNDLVVGCCALEVYNKKLAEIRTLVVRAGEERQGIATLLIEHCLSEARRRRVYEVLAITDRENLFKRQGFSEQLHGQKALFLRPGAHTS